MNTKSKLIVLSLSAAALLMIILQGCNLKSFVTLNLPKDVKEAVVDVDYLNNPITLNEADEIWIDWTAYVQSNTNKLETAIADAEERYAVVHQLTSIGITTAGDAANGFPFGGAIFGALTGAIGLFMPQPKMTKKKE